MGTFGIHWRRWKRAVADGKHGSYFNVARGQWHLRHRHLRTHLRAPQIGAVPKDRPSTELLKLHAVRANGQPWCASCARQTRVRLGTASDPMERPLSEAVSMSVSDVCVRWWGMYRVRRGAHRESYTDVHMCYIHV